MGSDQGSISGCRLSPQQELLLRNEAESRVQNALVQIRLDGTLDRKRLEHALDHVSRRHEILRTVFRRQIGRRTPFQIVEDTPLVAVEPVTAIAKMGPGDSSSGRPVVRVWVSTKGGHSDLVLELPAACADSTTLTLLVDEVAA